MVLVPGDVFRHLPVDIPAVLRMHALHGIPPVQLPGLVHGHLRHGGKALGHELRLHFPLRIAPNHRNSAGQIFQDRLKILRQPLLLPAQLNRPGHIPDDLHIGRDPVPVRFSEGSAVKAPGFRHNHLVLLSIRFPRLKRTVFAGPVLSVQGLIAFLPHSLPSVRKEALGLIDVEQVIIFFLDHVDSIRQIAGQVLEQAVFRGQTGKHGVKLRAVRQRPDPPAVKVNPDQAAVLVAHAVGYVQNLPAGQRRPGRGAHPVPIVLVDQVHGIAAGQTPVLFPGMPGKLHHSVGEIEEHKTPVLDLIAGDAARNGIDQVIHLLPGLLQIRNIVKNAVEQRETVFLPDPLDLRADPDDVAVPVLFAKFHGGQPLRADHLQRPGDHLGRVLPVGHICRIAFCQFPVLLRRIAGQFRHPVRKVHGLKPVGNLVNGNPARNRVDDVLQLLIGLRQLPFQPAQPGLTFLLPPVSTASGHEQALNPPFPAVQSEHGKHTPVDNRLGII